MSRGFPFIKNYNNMEQNIKQKVLECIERVYELAYDCKLEEAFFKKVDTDLSLLSDYFRVNKSQALFISIIFTKNFSRNGVDFEDLIRYFDCSPIKLLYFSDDFKTLTNSRIIKIIKKRFGGEELTVNNLIKEAILQNRNIPEKLTEEITDIIELLQKIYSLGVDRESDEKSTIELFAETKELLQTFQDFPLIQKINQFNFQIEDTYFFLYLIWKTILGSESIDIGKAMEVIFDQDKSRVKYMTKLYMGENDLVNLKLVDFVEARFFNNTEIKLSELSIALLKENNIAVFSRKKKKGNVLYPADIPFKELLFCKEDMNQIYTLKDLLQEPKFTETQQRLTNINLPKGINVMLHGLPGTGKTEIVKQLAKESGRALMKVEISQSKSMWFGESEKIIKRIFTDYKAFAEECSTMPILLFNEADAILSKRKETASNVGQTENAIQNILLEELENFEGILIATTNLISNLDKAFERRFLFKIQFQKPALSIKAKIWQSKLKYLTMEESMLLAEKFDFSGGQIENVYRKAEIHEIIKGKSVGFDDLLAFCEEETLEQQVSKIGFM
jgi:AAA+ superfamily predicted ATPase